MLYASYVLLVLAITMGVALQNGSSALFILVSLVTWSQKARADTGSIRWSQLLATFRIPLMASFGVLGSLVMATALNPANKSGVAGALELIPGYLGWCLVPYLTAATFSLLSSKERERLLRIASIWLALMGLVVWTQVAWRWKLVQSGIAYLDPGQVARAQGFFSHPLTLAYVGLTLFPAGLLQIIHRPRVIWSWLWFGGALSMVITAGSRTVQVVALGLTLFTILRLVRGRARVLILAGFLVLGTVVAVTDNPISFRYRETLKRGDVHSDYPDDRLLFWHAHWLMWQDRPLVGHGDHLNQAYRHPYYEALGMGQFDRQYEAHNMYIQVAINAGLVGLAFFLLWWGWHLVTFAPLARRSWVDSLILQSFAVYMLAAMTQNAFQDFESRYALTILTAFAWWRIASRSHDATKPLSAPFPRP